MLTTVDVQNRNSVANTLLLSLSNPSNGYIVKNIDGLDPVKATLSSAPFASLDGQQFYGSKKEARNIRIQVELKKGHPSKTIRQLRTELYSVFMPETEVTLGFQMADGLYVNINGVVETCESALFTKDPAIDISIMCYSPDFTVPSSETLSGVSEYSLDINYTGTVKSGLTFTRPVSGDASFHLVLSHDGLEDQKLYYDASTLTTDVVTIKTTKGERSATLLRAGELSNVLWAVRGTSDWLQLSPGMNTLLFKVAANANDRPFDVTWTPRHGGL